MSEGVAARAGELAPEGPRAPWRHPAFGVTVAASALVAAVGFGFWRPLAGALTGFELALAGLFPSEGMAGVAWFVIPPAAFGAGLLASLSPCVLPLVPLNAAFIGAAEAKGWRAITLSARFVLGAALALSVLGLAADVAGFVLIEQRGLVLIGVGLLMAFLGLAAVEMVALPLAGRVPGAGRRLGPVAAGAAFSLVTSPCASPLLAGVLAAAAAQQVPGLSVVSMGSFALGYTGLVFAAGVFGGSLIQRFRTRSLAVPRAVAGGLLVVAGGGFALAGLTWF